MRICLFFLLIFSSISLFSQIESPTIGGLENASGACNTSFITPFAVQNNPAMMSEKKGISAGVFSERKFLLQSLSQHNASLFISKNWGAIGLGINYTGDAVFSQQKIQLSYARKIAKSVNLGVGFHFTQFTTKDFEPIQTINAQVGLNFMLIEKLYFSGTINNPFPQKIEEHNIPLESALGLHYIPSTKVQFRAEAHLSSQNKADFRMGVDYQPIQILSIQIGYKSYPSSFSGGFGLNFSSFKLNVFVQSHDQLKLSPGLSLSFINFDKLKI